VGAEEEVKAAEEEEVVVVAERRARRRPRQTHHRHKPERPMLPPTRNHEFSLMFPQNLFMSADLMGVAGGVLVFARPV